jgi:hypothetical protein
MITLWAKLSHHVAERLSIDGMFQTSRRSHYFFASDYNGGRTHCIIDVEDTERILNPKLSVDHRTWETLFSL